MAYCRYGAVGTRVSALWMHVSHPNGRSRLRLFSGPRGLPPYDFLHVKCVPPLHIAGCPFALLSSPFVFSWPSLYFCSLQPRFLPLLLSSQLPFPPTMSVLEKSPKTDDKLRLKRLSKGRVFQCTGYPDCNMSFTRSEHLARHKRKHTGERPFTCPHCSKNFSRLDNLRQHKQTVHAYENFVSKDKKDIPETPIHHGHLYPQSVPYHPVHTPPFVSPPNLSSPQSYPHSAPQPPPPQQHVAYYPSYVQADHLKLPSHEFKPKRRPRPLLLLHSFTDSSPASSAGTAAASPYNSYYLKTAPPVPSHSYPHPIMRGYGHGPKSASLTPNMVSPLSPLFHQSFNQTAAKSSLLTTYNESPAQLKQQPVVPVHLPAPANFKPLEKIPSMNTLFKSIPNASVKPEWLPSILNDRTNPPENNTNHVSKKPTINSLLSPCDEDKFPAEVTGVNN